MPMPTNETVFAIRVITTCSSKSIDPACNDNMYSGTKVTTKALIHIYEILVWS